MTASTTIRNTFLLLVIFAAACSSGGTTGSSDTTSAASTSTPFQPDATGSVPTEPSQDQTLWVSPAVPDALREAAFASGIPAAVEAGSATMVLDIQSEANSTPPESTWIYAVVVPFDTVPDEVALDDLRRSWAGELTGPFAGRPFYLTASTLETFTALWGAPAMGVVQVTSAEGMVATAWENWPCWGIVPFEELEPRWKVLAVDGQSPIHKDFDPTSYPLVVPFSLNSTAISLPDTNRDATKMTTLVMTGVTALVRATADRMEKNGITYPAEGILDWLQSADITHISNEISFVEDCPTPDANNMSLTFCSSPRYMELLQYAGADVIELTGNHMNDWGTGNFLYTLDLYRQANLPTFGGGADSTAATTPLLIENNGNKLAFIGCNSVGPEADWADSGYPGSAYCGDFTWMTDEISRLRSEGYLPVATFQYSEYYTPYAPENQVRDFGRMADAGAAIVSGSQSHFPMAAAFRGDAFIHYGLGNLFFDQMYYTLSDGTVITGTRREFIDRYVIYDNRVISVELLTAQLEDYARPRPMTDMERSQMLEDIFTASGWR